MIRSCNIYLCSCTIALEMITLVHGKLYLMYEQIIDNCFEICEDI